jgi:hypothetical protein
LYVNRPFSRALHQTGLSAWSWFRGAGGRTWWPPFWRPHFCALLEGTRRKRCLPTDIHHCRSRNYELPGIQGVPVDKWMGVRCRPDEMHGKGVPGSEPAGASDSWRLSNRLSAQSSIEGESINPPGTPAVQMRHIDWCSGSGWQYVVHVRGQNGNRAQRHHALCNPRMTAMIVSINRRTESGKSRSSLDGGCPAGGQPAIHRCSLQRSVGGVCLTAGYSG